MIIILFLLFFPITAFSSPIIGMDIGLSCGVRETYDDNITYAESNAKSDFITSIDLGVTAKYEGKNQAFGLSGNITPNFFAKNDRFDNTSQDYSANFTQELSKYERISLKNTFGHAEEPRSFEEELGRTNGRYSANKNIFNINYSREVSRHLSFILKYRNEMDWYSRNDLSDSFLNSAGLESDYALTSNTVLLASYDFTRRDFDPGSHTYMQTIAGGLRQYFTSRLYFDAQGGVNFVNPVNGKNTAKPLFLFSFTGDIDQNTQALISFKKQYNTNAYSSDIFDYSEVSGRLSRQLSERLSGSVSLFYGRGKYITTKIKDKVSGARFGLSRDLTKDIKANLGYSYSQTTSNISTREYKKNVVTAGLTAAF